MGASPGKRLSGLPDQYGVAGDSDSIGWVWLILPYME